MKLDYFQKFPNYQIFFCFPDQLEVVAHRRLRLRRPDDRHRLRRLLLLLQGQNNRQEQHPL